MYIVCMGYVVHRIIRVNLLIWGEKGKKGKREKREKVKK